MIAYRTFTTTSLVATVVLMTANLGVFVFYWPSHNSSLTLTVMEIRIFLAVKWSDFNVALDPEIDASRGTFSLPHCNHWEIQVSPPISPTPPFSNLKIETIHFTSLFTRLTQELIFFFYPAPRVGYSEGYPYCLFTALW